MDDDTPHDATATVRVRSVAVDPGWQGRGVGAELMASLERRAYAAEFDQVVLKSPGALPGTHEFYRSLGYRVACQSRDDGYVWFRRSLADAVGGV